MGSLLKGVGNTEYGRLLEGLADELDRNRQPTGAKARADRDRRIAGDIERHHKAGLFE